MNPEYRRDWLLFAFILWFGLGVAYEKPALVVLAAITAVLPLRWPQRRQRTPVQVNRHDPDDGEALDV